MLEYLRSLIVIIYIHLAGVRFYYTETLPVKKDISKFIVKTLHGYEITFTFYKEKTSFTQYFFSKLRKRECITYVVAAYFDEHAPISVQRYNSVRIFVRDSFLFLSNEPTIVRILLNVYLDYLLSDMQTDIDEVKDIIPLEGDKFVLPKKFDSSKPKD